ncbi:MULTISPECIES: EpsG family protein [Chryseobacterium]|uniref:EpsG family protein n=1 Tax=Chryseobacterium TaxID=59732 RepID=UPI000D127455|nr:EpsG family protein [Chryseobacterium aurantiacum]
MDIPILIIYISSIFLLIFLNKSIKKSFGGIYIITVFCYLIASRSDKVPDTLMYLAYFNDEDTNFGYYRAITGFEEGFRFFTKIIKTFTEDSNIYMGAICILNMLVINYSSKRIINNYNLEWGGESNKKIIYFSSLLLLLYISFFGIYVNAIVLRVGMAYSIIYYAASIALDPQKKGYSKYIIIAFLLFVAYLMHSTAFILGAIILSVLMFSKQLKRETYIITLILIFLVYFLNLSTSIGIYLFKIIGSGDSAFAAKLDGYSSGFGALKSEGFSLKFLFFWSMSFVLSLNKKENKIYYKLLNILIIGVLIHSLFRSILLVERITDYFTFYSFILFYLFLSSKKNLLFEFLLLLVIVVCQLIFILRITNLELIA